MSDFTIQNDSKSPLKVTSISRQTPQTESTSFGQMLTDPFLKLLIIVIAISASLAPVTRSLALSDKLIQQRIENKAADTFRLRETKVNVAVEDGYVVLYGTVGLYIQKMLYEQIAWKAKGVVEVDNEIRVVPRLQQSDADIERKVLGVVQNHSMLQSAIHKVTVEGGAVLVHATFQNPGDVHFFKHQLAEIEGVISIDIRAKFIALHPQHVRIFASFHTAGTICLKDLKLG